MGWLRVKKSNGETDAYPIKGDLKIGRSPDNDIIFDNPETDKAISRHHAKIVEEGEKTILYDLESLNGTFVNDVRVMRKVLEDGDEISIGKNVLTFEERAPEKIILLDDKPQITATTSRSPRQSKLFKTLDRNLLLLYQFSEKLRSTIDLRELLELIMDCVIEATKAQNGVLMLIEKDKDELVPKVVRKEQAGESLEISGSIVKKVIEENVPMLIADTLTDQRFMERKSIQVYGIKSAMCVPLYTPQSTIGVIYLDNPKGTDQFMESDLDLLNAIANEAALAIEQVRLMEKVRKEAVIRAHLERFHSPDVVRKILEESPTLGGEEIEATVLFGDIKGFTTFAEKLPPSRVVQELNEFFSVMTDVIFELGGTLDKYLGDGIMAIFGAPYPQADHAERAVSVGLLMQEKLKTLVHKWQEKSWLSMRIGVNSGRMIAGNVGSLKRMEYTVLGDTVNVASRLQAMAEPNKVWITEETYKKVKKAFKVEAKGVMEVVGRKGRIGVYEVIGNR